MTNDDRLMALWTTGGLRSEGLGPQGEWDPVDAAAFQARHNEFWATVSDIMPEDEHDEPFWMSEDAATRLSANGRFRDN